MLHLNSMGIKNYVQITHGSYGPIEWEIIGNKFIDNVTHVNPYNVVVLDLNLVCIFWCRY